MRRLSSTERRGNRRRFSGTWATPSSITRCAGTSLSEAPSRRISPALTSISLEITRKSVVLPAPFGPITATASPARTSSETPNRAWKVP